MFILIYYVYGFLSEELMIDGSADEVNQYLYDMICVKDSPSAWDPEEPQTREDYGLQSELDHCWEIISKSDIVCRVW